MTDSNTNLEVLKNKVAEFINERDWVQFHNPKDLSMSISIEAAELMELFQWKRLEEVECLKGDSIKIQEIKNEIADIIIYSLSLSNCLGIDVSDAILTKLRQNAKKYPIDKIKGKAEKYNKIK